MNDRIEKLALQAVGGWPSYDAEGEKKMSETEYKKFAELIVQECLEACSRANEVRHFVPPTQEQVVLSCMREIEQHFGIE